MSIKTALTHISEHELAEHLTEILDRVANGERVEVQREGTTLAVLAPPPPAADYDSPTEYIPEKHEPAFDEDFVEAVLEVRRWANTPPRERDWPE